MLRTFNQLGVWRPVFGLPFALARSYLQQLYNRCNLSTTVSIIIPAYNEGRRLRASLPSLLRYVREQRWQAEIIVVNDGSSDDTAAAVREFAAAAGIVRLVENPGNRGKGFSVRNGMMHATGDVLLFSDADFSSPIEEAPKLFAAIAAGADIAIGSRWLRSETQTERQPLFRQISGRAFNLLLRGILGLNYKDTQCGFKAFSRRAARMIFPMQRIERWGFDPEILFLARRLQLSVKEVPVQWAHDHGSRVRVLRDGLRMVLELLSIRWNAARGRYRIAAASASYTSTTSTPR
jgi:dolichyl-phosphate beta-glucosyltransferase